MSYSLFFNNVENANRIALFMHINPDADCVGSCLALYKYLKKLGKVVEVFLEKGNILKENLKAFPNSNCINRAKFSTYDLGIAVDCANLERLGKGMKEAFLYGCDYQLWIDHHLSKPPIANYIQEIEVAATAQIVYKIFKSHQIDLIDYDIAFCLFGAIAADSLLFSSSSSNQETLLVASELIGYGIDGSDVVRKVYLSKTIPEFELTKRAYASTDFHFNGKAAIISFFIEDFRETKTEIASTEGIINDIVMIEDVYVAISFAQENANTFKVSIRSKHDIDASEIAGEFGGGGHKYAAGCKIKGSYEECKMRLLQVISNLVTW